MNKTHQAIFAIIASGVVEKPEGMYKVLSDIITNDLFALMGDEMDISQVHSEKWHLKDVLHDISYLISCNIIEHRHAKQILHDAWDMEPYAWDMGWYLSDSKILEEKEGDELDEAIRIVMISNEKAVNDIRGGKVKAVGSLIGQVMKESGGQANPKLISKRILELINQ